MKNAVLFASGGGSNAEAIMNYAPKGGYKVAAVFTNNAHAGVTEKAGACGVPVVVFTRGELEGGAVLQKLRAFNPQLIVLAGFLWKFPAHIIDAFPHKVINIHPALLPKYGGKGMYGMHVHRAVLDNREAESGITIHYVDNNYDEGATIFQKAITIEECRTAEDVARKVLALEHAHLPEVIERLLRQP